VSEPFVIETLGAHDRRAFRCGVPALDRYLQEQAGQDVKRRVSNCFVAVDRLSNEICGYYTLAAASVAMRDLPPEQAKRLPRYPLLPATLIGRLAVASHQQGRRLGGALLIDALQRTVLAAPASFALIVDAKDENAAGFYARHGFLPLASRANAMFLPIGTALKLFGAA